MCCLEENKTVSKPFQSYLTLRNTHFSDDCALIASYSAQVYCWYNNISLYSVSPSAMSRLLHRSCFRLRRFFPLAVSAIWWRKYLHVTAPSSPFLSLLIASLYRARRDTFGSVFVSISCWIRGAMQKTIWHDVVLKRASLCDAVPPMPALICSTLYSPVPDGRLKSIILPPEMCFPEHYIQTSEQGAALEWRRHLLDGTVAPPKSCGASGRKKRR